MLLIVKQSACLQSSTSSILLQNEIEGEAILPLNFSTLYKISRRFLISIFFSILFNMQNMQEPVNNWRKKNCSNT